MNLLYPKELLFSLQDFYQKVDQLTTALTHTHSSRLNCRIGCYACCVDDLEVFGIEAALISDKHQNLLKTETPHALGQCAFLGQEGKCSIYKERPFVCRTHGLPLRWIEQEEGEWVEYRDICTLNEEGPSLESLPQNQVLSTQVLEEQLAFLQLKADNGHGHRVRLRELFGSK